MSDLRRDIESAINRNSAENGSNTPDFMLAEFLIDCLAAFDKTVRAREAWYNRNPDIGPAGIITNNITLKSDPVSSNGFCNAPIKPIVLGYNVLQPNPIEADKFNDQ